MISKEALSNLNINRVIIAILSVVAVISIYKNFFSSSSSTENISLPNTNAFIAAENYKGSSPLNITINAPTTLDNQSLKTLEDIRSTILKQYPSLIQSPYTLSKAVFQGFLDEYKVYALYCIQFN